MPYVKFSTFIQQQRVLNVLLYNKALCLLINEGQDFFSIIRNENVFACMKQNKKDLLDFSRWQESEDSENFATL